MNDDWNLYPCEVVDVKARYPSITVNGKKQRLHRYTYEQHYGPIPDGYHVCHRCDVSRCIQPRHLFLGTQADNVQDMMEKGRHFAQRMTHCKHGHPLTGDNVRLIPIKGTPYTRRQCRECDSEAHRRMRERRKAKELSTGSGVVAERSVQG
jgi:hypothetical protein